ncbi:hypothetical protein GTA08_BOTSDO08120 [Botryosphaeria dothidea]|uniref:Cell wall protein n=1 Tax=Botryosphaeria dothidea TaxID=55169 RepID=A0A8H4INH1_9PEZI|nr:hypothetical protein GTA08_BOTSDO08120 [Botryosphaeria dothidea]
MQLTTVLVNLVLATLSSTAPAPQCCGLPPPQCCEVPEPPPPPPPPPPCGSPVPNPNPRPYPNPNPNPNPNPIPNPIPNPNPPAAATNRTFGIMALRSASPIHFLSVVATQSGLQLGKKQDAACDKPSDYATFLLDNSTAKLFLYDGPKSSYQQLYTDRSGMGQGVLQYTRTRDQTLNPNRIETTGFVVPKDSPDLQFKDVGFLACPGTGDIWSVWLDAGVANPGGITGCLGFSARAVDTTDPVACVYT